MLSCVALAPTSRLFQLSKACLLAHSSFHLTPYQPQAALSPRFPCRSSVPSASPPSAAFPVSGPIRCVGTSASVDGSSSGPAATAADPGAAPSSPSTPSSTPPSGSALAGGMSGGQAPLRAGRGAHAAPHAAGEQHAAAAAAEDDGQVTASLSKEGRGRPDRVRPPATHGPCTSAHARHGAEKVHTFTS